MTPERACSSCGAPVWWLRHVRTGNASPINVAPEPGGNLVVSLERGLYRFATADDPMEPRHKTHFADCPDSKRWRGAKRRGEG